MQQCSSIDRGVVRVAHHHREYASRQCYKPSDCKRVRPESWGALPDQIRSGDQMAHVARLLQMEQSQLSIGRNAALTKR